MGASPNFLFDSLKFKGMVLLENNGNFTTRSSNPSNNSNNGSLYTTTTTSPRAKVVRQTRRKQRNHLRKTRKVVLMKKMVRSNCRRRDENGIQRKVETLKRLIPSYEQPSDDHEGLEGLFRDTASYIISLQMRVRVMQFMVDVLENSQDDHHQ